MKNSLQLAAALGMIGGDAFGRPRQPIVTDNAHNKVHNLRVEISRLEAQQRDKYAQKRLDRLKAELAHLEDLGKPKPKALAPLHVEGDQVDLMSFPVTP